jgi:hypothetical protein
MSDFNRQEIASFAWRTHNTPPVVGLVFIPIMNLLGGVRHMPFR